MPSTLKGSVAAVLLAVLSVLVLLYSILIAQGLTLGLVAVGFFWVAYVLFQLVGILARIATSLKRLVDQRVEREREQ